MHKINWERTLLNTLLVRITYSHMTLAYIWTNLLDLLYKNLGNPKNISTQIQKMSLS